MGKIVEHRKFKSDVDIESNSETDMLGKNFNIDVVVGSRIYRKRIDYGLSLYEMSEKFSISPALLELYEAGEKRVPSRVILRMAEVLGVEISYLFGVSQEQPRPWLQ